MSNYNLITLTGPTASGKTDFAAHLAKDLGGEIISADSRQVYRGMDLGTGKDLADYTVGGQAIPYHVIDVADAGEKYNVYRFQQDFVDAFTGIRSRGAWPILCGGTGMYIEAVLKGYKMIHVPPNTQLRKVLEQKSHEELVAMLADMKRLHNDTDTDSKQRTIRGIEIETYYQNHSGEDFSYPEVRNLLVAVDIDRDLRRKKISQRLRTRFDVGMVDEVRALLSKGVPSETLIYYGLEYKYITLHVLGQLSFSEMLEQLEIAIHQFAKRQMTWFRGMERRGLKVNWISYQMPISERIDLVKEWLMR